MKLLLVEDEKKVAQFIKDALERENYSVEVAYDGEEGEQRALEDNFDLIILDILLPKKDGLSLLKNLREKKISTPVLFLTAKSSVEDRVAGLDLGADDYLPKPFAVTELLARVRSLIRRGTSASVLRVGDLVLNPLTRKVWRQKYVFIVRSKEFTLLELFM